MAESKSTVKGNKGVGVLITILNVVVLLIVFGLSRTYPLPACIFAAIYFSILLGITISKYNAAKEAGEDTKGLKRSLGGYIAWIIFIAIVLLFQIWNTGGFRSSSINSNYETPSELAARGVQETKASTSLPYEVDDITRLIDITSSGANIQYHYILHDADTSSLTSADLKASVRPSVCANTSTKALLARGVGMQYLYTDQGTSSNYSFVVTNADC